MISWPDGGRKRPCNRSAEYQPSESAEPPRGFLVQQAATRQVGWDEHYVAGGVALLLGVQQVVAVAVSSETGLKECNPLLISLAVLVMAAAVLLLILRSTGVHKHDVVPALIVVFYTSVAFLAVFGYDDPGHAAILLGVVLRVVEPLMAQRGLLCLTVVSVAAWTVTLSVRPTYTFERAFTPCRVLGTAHVAVLLSSVRWSQSESPELQSERDADSDRATEAGPKTDPLKLESQGSDPIELLQTIGHSDTGVPLQSPDTDKGLVAEHVPSSILQRSPKPARSGLSNASGSNVAWGLHIDGCFVRSPEAEHASHIGPRKVSVEVMKVDFDDRTPLSPPVIHRRYPSQSSQSSEASAISGRSSASFVSFNPTVARTLEGGRSFIFLPESREADRENGAEELDSPQRRNSVAALDTEQPPNAEEGSPMLCDLTISKRRVTKRPLASRRASMLKLLDTIKSPPPPTPLPGTEWKNSAFLEVVAATAGSPSSLGGAQSRQGQQLAAIEVRHTMKSVVREMGMSHQSEGSLSRCFESFPAPVLQRLLLLHARLLEDIDVYRVQQAIQVAVCEICECDHCMVFLVSRDEMWSIADDGTELIVPVNGSLVGLAAVSNRSISISDSSDGRLHKEHTNEKLFGQELHNLLLWPVARSSSQRRNDVIAVIRVANKHRGMGFTRQDEALLSFVGSLGATHLSNVRTLGRLALEYKRISTLLEVSREIADVTEDLGKMMERIMTRARSVLATDRASVFLIDEAKGELWSVVTDPEMAAELGGDKAGLIRIPVTVGLAGYVARTGKLVNCPDVQQSPLFHADIDKLTGFISRTALCVPISVTDPETSKTKITGVIQFINKLPGGVFTEEDEQLALALASCVGISLNNLLLYDSLREGKHMKEQNRELVRLRDEARQAAEAKANFLMSMSHEIRTPMSGVIGYCELLLQSRLNPELQEMAKIIRSCGESLMAIVNDILDYGRIESGRLVLEEAELSLLDLLEECIDVVRSKAEDCGLSLIVDIAFSLPNTVLGDAHRIRQVLTNLLGNAVKFTPSGGSVTLLAKRLGDVDTPLPGLEGYEHHPDTVFFSVNDTGIGIDPSKVATIFKPFEQADAGTTRQYGGSGLGLAISKQLVEAMGGHIGIVNNPRGTTFWFTVALPKASPSTILEMQINHTPEREKDITVLLAILNQQQNQVVHDICTSFGARVDRALCILDLESKIEAIAKRGTTCLPNVVIIDEAIDTTGEDKLCTILLQLKEAKKHVPRHLLNVCLLTTMANKARMCGTMDVAAVLAKPPKVSALAKLLEQG
eukprot:Sspe_Gene.28174::Locus_12605_Transcript_1_1_Confidence_1.000_Length_3918::g.28174::m.28174